MVYLNYTKTPKSYLPISFAFGTHKSLYSLCESVYLFLCSSKFTSFLRTSLLFSTVAVPLSVLNNSSTQQQCNSSPHSVQRFLFVDILIMEILIIVVPHCGFNLHFINNKWHWASIFLCFLAIWMSSLGKCVCRSSARFLIGLLMFLLLSWMSCFCILEISLDLKVWN